MSKNRDLGASGKPDRAVVNGAGQAVSALRASVPSADDWAGLVLDAFDAGVRRGVDEATAFDWGSSPTGKYHDNLAEVLHDWANEGRDWRTGDMVLWETVETALAQAIEARRAETRSGSVEDESAVAKPCAPTPPPSSPKD